VEYAANRGQYLPRTYHVLRKRLGSPIEMKQKDGVVTCAGHAADGSEVRLG
jgi:hypothetical protein